MVRQRSVGLYVVLSLITCGLFAFYWMYVLTEDVAAMSGDRSFTGGKHVLLTLITCGIWSLVWDYQLGGQIAAAQQSRGYPVKDNGLIYLLLGVFGFTIISIALAQIDVNKIV